MMENEEKEKQLIADIRSLFEELKEIKKGKIVSGMYILPPNNYTYVKTAKELIKTAYELSELNTSYDTSGLASVLNKEILRVSLHELEYDKNKKLKNKSVQTLKGLMHDATYHIRLYFMEVLGDIEV